MKKLMFMLAAVATAAVVQAASVSWNSGVVFAPSDANGTISATSTYKMADSSTASMYLFIIAGDATHTAAENFAAVQSAGAYATYKDSLGSATDSSSTLSSSKFGALSSSGHAASETVYAAVIFTYKDGAGKDWYLENYATTTIKDLGADGTVNNLARYIGGVKTNGDLASWSSASSVPEPTSGLLMLVGLAGLALRRGRRA